MSTTTVGVARRRALLAALLGAALGCVLLATVLIGLSGGASGPATGAVALVPGDAYAYVHLSTDRGRSEVRQGRALLSRLPVAPPWLQALQERLTVASPWLGREAALADLPGGSLAVLDVRDSAAAHRSLRALGAVPAGRYRGHVLLREPDGSEVAFVRHYAAIGPDAVVRGAIDARLDRGASLQSVNAYRRAMSDAPDDRVLDAYVSGIGARQLLTGRRGALAALSTLLGSPTLLGVGVSVSPGSGQLRVRIHTAYDSAISGLSAGSTKPFTPTLQHVIPAGATLLVDQRRLQNSAPGLLSAGAAAGIGTAIPPLLARLGAALGAEGVNVPAVLSVFGGESAVALVPPDTGGAQALLIVARVRNEASARATLASVEAPLANLFASASADAQTPLLGDVQVGDIALHELSLGPGLRLDYTVAHGLVIASTSRAVAEAALRRATSLDATVAYRRVLPRDPGTVSSLLFLDFNQLLNLVEQAGLTRGAQYQALRPDLAMIRAVGVRATSGEADSTAELSLQIS